MTSSVPLLVPKRHLGRASGMVQLNNAVATLMAPALAGVLMTFIDIGGILLIDLGTFLVGLITLLMVRIPRPAASTEGRPRGTLFADVAAGWRYLRARSGMLGLLGLFAATNFLIAFTSILYVPLILGFASKLVLGTTISAGGIAMVVSSLALAAFGLPKRKMATLLGLTAISGLFVALLGLFPSVVVCTGALLMLMVLSPFARGANQVLWQTKVPPDLQGRAFALRRMSAQAAAPVAYILVGPLADHVFKPLLVEGGPLADSVGRIVGVGPSRGIGLMLLVAGALAVLLALAGWIYPRTRRIEEEIPDAVDEATAVADPSPADTVLGSAGVS